MNREIPRAEHPLPQMERESWQNLNGEWSFAFDFGKSGLDRKWYEKDSFDSKIIVPFCPESRLSGIGHTDFIPAVWYQKNVEISEEQLAGHVLWHFGAVDYECHAYVNGKEVGMHKGGYTSFSFDITEALTAGTNSLVVYAADDTRSSLQPTGKQSDHYESYGCSYTRTTGIWQTVWLEFVPAAYVKAVQYYPDIQNKTLTVTGITEGAGTLTLTAKWQGQEAAAASVQCMGGYFSTRLAFDEIHLWELGKGGLYDLEITYGEDKICSYFGMRSTCFAGRKYLLNGKSVFQRTVLDQGFYPEGIYTAPTDADLVKDIELSMAAGFNGARLHEKVFESRFLYHCDRLGYMVWGEYPNWGVNHADPQMTEIYMAEWQEAVSRDFNHPSIIGWCPFNETWGYREEQQKNALISSIYKLTKWLDPTRPCIDASGNHHSIAEVFDMHDYDGKPDRFKKRWDGFVKAAREKGYRLDKEDYKELVHGPGEESPFFGEPYRGQPIYISEYGGIRWAEETSDGWGYGQAPRSAEEFFDRYRGLTEAMLNNEEIFGFCYTQLYDVEQEVNGLYTYERNEKFDIGIIRAINSQKAAIED